MTKEELIEYAKDRLIAIDIDFGYKMVDALEFYGEGELYDLEYVLESRKRIGRLILLGAELSDLGFNKEILNELFGSEKE